MVNNGLTGCSVFKSFSHSNHPHTIHIPYNHNQYHILQEHYSNKYNQNSSYVNQSSISPYFIRLISSRRTYNNLSCVRNIIRVNSLKIINHKTIAKFLKPKPITTGSVILNHLYRVLIVRAKFQFLLLIVGFLLLILQDSLPFPR